MRPSSAGLAPEAAHDDRMIEPLEQLDLALETCEGRRVLDEIGPHDLRDDQRPQPLVPGEVGLVPQAAAQQLERREAGDDLVLLAELPAGMKRFAGQDDEPTDENERRPGQGRRSLASSRLASECYLTTSQFSATLSLSLALTTSWPAPQSTSSLPSPCALMTSSPLSPESES